VRCLVFSRCPMSVKVGCAPEALNQESDSEEENGQAEVGLAVGGDSRFFVVFFPARSAPVVARVGPFLLSDGFDADLAGFIAFVPFEPEVEADAFSSDFFSVFLSPGSFVTFFSAATSFLSGAFIREMN
jgi:hypothetical protein